MLRIKDFTNGNVVFFAMDKEALNGAYNEARRAITLSYSTSVYEDYHSTPLVKKTGSSPRRGGRRLH